MSDNQFSSLWWLLFAILLMLFGIMLNTTKADPLPPQIQYLCRHWLETDHKGNQLGYNLKQFALAASDDGEFKVQCGYDAGHYRRLSNNRLIWIADPNKVMVECAEIRMKWDEYRWLHYVDGELYIEPSMADANSLAERWMEE